MEATQEEIYPMPSFPVPNATDGGSIVQNGTRRRSASRLTTMKRAGCVPLLAHLRWVKYADVLLGARGTCRGGQARAGHRAQFQRIPGREDGGRNCRTSGSMWREDSLTSAAMPWNTRECTIEDPDGYRLQLSPSQ